MKHSVNIGVDVFTAGVARLHELYENGHEVVVTMSGGKDSTICAELAIIAARMTDRLPVKMIMRDEEIMFPGTFEYCERLANRPEIDFHWVSARQPVINMFNRELPYIWVFDPLLPETDWVRQPPSFCEFIADKDIDSLVTRERFPTPDDKLLIKVMGLRVEESPNRKLGLISSGGHLTKVKNGIQGCRPIYDWSTGHVWRAIREMNWDYNTAYNVLFRAGLPIPSQRIAPPLQTAAQFQSLAVAGRAWPQWFDRVCERAPGARTGAQFGRRAVEPQRRSDETWEQCFERLCVQEAPEWIADRAKTAREKILRRHARHSTVPFPDVKAPRGNMLGSWKMLCKVLYSGDPFVAKTSGLLKPVEPDFFRPGDGKWGGTPGFS